MLRVGGEEAQTGILVDCGVLEKSKLRVSNTAPGNYFYIYLYALPRVLHLLVRFWYILLLWLFRREHPHSSHYTEQALRAAGITSLVETMPKLYHPQLRVSAAYIFNELYFILCMLVWVPVGSSGLASK